MRSGCGALRSGRARRQFEAALLVLVLALVFGAPAPVCAHTLSESLSAWRIDADTVRLVSGLLAVRFCLPVSERERYRYPLRRVLRPREVTYQLRAYRGQRRP